MSSKKVEADRLDEPILRADIDPATLESASMADQDGHELPEANLTWFVEQGEPSADRRRRVKKLARHFWTVATTWAHRLANSNEYLGDHAGLDRRRLPDGRRALERSGPSRMAHAIPEFKTAQQAMAYLGLTLNEVQLRALFSTDESIASFVERLGVAAQTQDEREAIAHLVGLEKLFRNKKYGRRPSKSFGPRVRSTQSQEAPRDIRPPR